MSSPHIISSMNRKEQRKKSAICKLRNILFLLFLCSMMANLVILRKQQDFMSARTGDQNQPGEEGDNNNNKMVPPPPRRTRGGKVAPPIVIGYVVSLIKCPEQTSNRTVGFIDSATILRHSIHRTSTHNNNPHTLHHHSKYSYKMYAIIHTQCSHHAPIFESVGYTVLLRSNPVLRSEMRNPWYKANVENEVCCGSDEFIKLYAYELEEHPIVVHLDMDVILTRPFDVLYDAMLTDERTQEGMMARERLKEELELVEYDGDRLPQRIDAFYTMDYTSSWPWKEKAPIQGGFLVLRPDRKALDVYKEIIREGNYKDGFNNEAGWEGLGYGGFIGGKAIQGIWAYYYGHINSGVGVELNVCRWNQVAADVKWREKRKGHEESVGECNRFPRHLDGNHSKNFDCEDCRFTPVDQLYSVHYTACKKPWTCPVARVDGVLTKFQRHRMEAKQLVDLDMCMKLHREWFRLRKDLEDSIFRHFHDDAILSTRNGQFKSQYFLGYCDAEKIYHPVAFPADMTKNQSDSHQTYFLHDLYGM